MKRTIVLTKGRIAAALGVAVLADLIQLPLTLALLGSVLSAAGFAAAAPIEALDLAIDLATAGLQIWLLGFHWALLPTALIEAVPLLSLAPTWTGCVLWVVAQRKRDAANVPRAPRV